MQHHSLSELPMGTVLGGHYHIIRLPEQGGMSRVVNDPRWLECFRHEDQAAGCPVALGLPCT